MNVSYEEVGSKKTVNTYWKVVSRLFLMSVLLLLLAACGQNSTPETQEDPLQTQNTKATPGTVLGIDGPLGRADLILSQFERQFSRELFETTQPMGIRGIFPQSSLGLLFRENQAIPNTQLLYECAVTEKSTGKSDGAPDFFLSLDPRCEGHERASISGQPIPPSRIFITPQQGYVTLPLLRCARANANVLNRTDRFAASVAALCANDRQEQVLGHIPQLVQLPPTNFTSSGSPTEVRLNWTAPGSQGSYRLFRSLDGGTTFTQIATPGRDDTSFVDTNVFVGTRYVYRLNAVNGTGITSAGVQTTVDTVLPPVTNLTATTPSQSVRLTWTPPTVNVAELCYGFFRSTDNVNFTRLTPDGQSSCNTNTVTDFTIQPNTTYQYRVVVERSPISSAPATVLVTTPAQSGFVPNAPTDFLALTRPNFRAVTLTWVVPLGGAGQGYILQRSTDGVNFTQIATLPPTGIEVFPTNPSFQGFTDTQVQFNTTYTYRLTAFGLGGNGPTVQTTVQTFSN
jgi:hypothetical protein